ncbi:MAG: hypothetical protein KDD75_05400, partial [Caldilineaceae bacterium]|nr:hypothetical protein [Caldilineaceae bacterium]
MGRFVLRRLFASFVTLFLASIVVFALVRAVPGDIVQQMMGQMGGTEGEATLRRFFGIDQPAHIQYVKWLGTVLQGDLGT